MEGLALKMQYALAAGIEIAHSNSMEPTKLVTPVRFLDGPGANSVRRTVDDCCGGLEMVKVRALDLHGFPGAFLDLALHEPIFCHLRSQK